MSEEIGKKLTGGSESKYNLLYSVYSYPNIILPLFGGLLIDKLGIGISIIVFSSLLTLG
jgi:hypothetical protein